ncbi:unnamed protein product [Allacma fusca]|uniref:Uncharacterized protein n=1 Tax=Allacma fusca TaxID=39272 RepID=A0A8J2L0C9_9HEXA|nr:unnamed protein product [Allacma fusca]
MAFILYMTFFLKIYRACLILLSEELEACTKSLRDGSKCSEDPSLWTSTARTEEIFERKEIIQDIGDCLEAYYLIEDLLEEFMSHFGHEIISLFIFSFVIVSARAFISIFVFASSSISSSLYAATKTSVYAWQMYSFASNCTNVDSACKKILHLLHRMDFAYLPYPLQAKVNMLAIKLASNPPGISPGEFFKVDRHLLLALLASMSSYMIILIQFQVSDYGNQTCNCTLNTQNIPE